MQILVVDDHPPTLDLMRLTLTSLGHSVTTATSVGEALATLRTAPPDVILSDLTFTSADGHELDGHALAKAVRREPAYERIGLLAITGVASASARKAALRSGFDGVVVKPFDLEALIEQIHAFDRGQ